MLFEKCLIFFNRGHSIDIDLNLNDINKLILLIICSLLVLPNNSLLVLEIIFKHWI